MSFIGKLKDLTTQLPKQVRSQFSLQSASEYKQRD